MSTQRFAHTASLLPDGSGRVLIAGGGNLGGTLDVAEIFDPAGNGGSGSFVPTSGSLVEAREEHTATLLNDGTVLIAGGDNGVGALSTAEIFDPAANGGTGAFAATGSMFAPRIAHTATRVANGKVLIVGGSPAFTPSTDTNASPGPLSALDSAEYYDPGMHEFVGNPGALHVARTQHSATLLKDGTVLIVGGADDQGTVLQSAEIFSIATSRFVLAAGSMSTPRHNHTATLLNDGDVLIAGGLDNNGNLLQSAEIYRPGSQTFVMTRMPMLSQLAFHTATLLPSGQVLISGGETLDPATGTILINGSAELYDPVSSTFTAVEMAVPRLFQSATSLNDGRVLIAGGQICCTAISPFSGVGLPANPSAEVFSPSVQSFAAETASMVHPRLLHTATKLRDGRVLIAGGRDFGVGALNSTELYDPATSAFAPGADMRDLRSAHTATVLDSGEILVAGGLSFNGSNTVDTSDAELYKPDSGMGTFIPTGSLNQGRERAAAAKLVDGRVLITGGEQLNVDTGAYTILASSEIYDPTSGEFALTGDMTIARAFHTATTLADGTVLITGGQTANQGVTNSAEIFDPNGNGGLGTFSLLSAPMLKTRFLHTATRLGNGRVLIAGGSGDISAEIYDPSSQQFLPTGNMNQIRFDQTATLLGSAGDSKVLIAGGRVSDAFVQVIPLSSAELFDPSGNNGAGTFAPIGDMSTARAEQTATLLLSGDVLIAGGLGTNSTLSTAELFRTELFGP